VDDHEVAPDGSPVAVYLAVPPEPAFTPVLDHLAADASVLDLGCGAGRLTNLLARPGRDVWGVDESPAMLARLSRDVVAVEADLVGLDLGRRFDAVVLASHLVNEADVRSRRGFLEAVATHLAPDGVAYVQRHDPTSDTYRVGTSTQELPTTRGPLRLTLEVHERVGTWLRATSTMAFPDASWSQAFEAELLDDAAIDGAFAEVGLRLSEVLDGTWVSARHAIDQAPPALGA
jgi:SAM-dependent methyltransferase